jgi:hypothetical protein
VCAYDVVFDSWLAREAERIDAFWWGREDNLHKEALRRGIVTLLIHSQEPSKRRFWALGYDSINLRRHQLLHANRNGRGIAKRISKGHRGTSQRVRR